jgi:SecD/SecF fusion protein
MKPSLLRVLLCIVPVIIAGIVVAEAFVNNWFLLGVDLSGGTILVYEVDRTKTKDTYSGQELADALKRRVDPADLLNATIRSVAGGDRVEIVLPLRGAINQEKIEDIKNLISQQGKLEFRFLANTRDDNDAITRAREWVNEAANADKLRLANDRGEPPPRPLNADGEPGFTVTLQGEPHTYTYDWVQLGKQEVYSLQLQNSSKSPLKDEAMKNLGKAFVPSGHSFLLYTREIPENLRSDPQRLAPKDRDQGKKYEYFILTRKNEPNKEVTGQFLTSASRGVDEKSRWAVHFSFDATGADRFYELTTLNKPDAQGSFHRQLAVILDDQIESAPQVITPIRGNGQITGDFTDKQVDDLVTILRAGALPATLKTQPAAENTIGATLGADTIRKGAWSVVIAFFAILAFMLVYYRFAGLVACVALLANLLLTVAFMLIVKATFTLPGLAGLVLMLGMAVDANVLIYERLREERERGASLDLAIRNGYDRAFPTIIDTHLTSIFTAIVLYVVGNDQLKGFGISLTVGLIISLFTSLYMTRTMFKYWQANNWLTKLSMMQLFRRPNINFMAIRYYFFAATVILTILGAALFFARLPSGAADQAESGNRATDYSSVLNIDFIGGTELTARLKHGMKIEELREKLANCGLPDLSIEQGYTAQQSGAEEAELITVRTAEKDLNRVQQIITDRLGNDLKKKIMEVHLGATGKTAELTFIDSTAKETDSAEKKKAYASPAQVTRLLTESAREAGIVPFPFVLRKEDESEGQYAKMVLEPTDTDPATLAKLPAIVEQTKKVFNENPQPERLENFDAALAARTQEIALAAILASWAAILLYLWFRFGSWTFGAATVLCLIHDLFFTLGGIAICHYLYSSAFGRAVALGDFKIDLPAVAALLTLVGYSVSDTIVVFDRIREVRGKNPALTPQMINDSVNQTLSRTILSSLSVWLVVIVLYIWGGEGVHLFAFVMVIGVIVGTYSSIYIASPLLLIFGEGAPRHAHERARLQAAAAAEA